MKTFTDNTCPPINIGDSLLLDVIDTVMKSLLLLSRMPIGFLFEVFFFFHRDWITENLE